MAVTQLIQFSFEKNNIRTTIVDGEPWFVAADVCVTLGIKNHRESVRHLDNDEKDVISNDTLGGKQQVTVINESGLYALVLRSRKPEARRFAKWVTSEVLPTIRKTGKYEVTKKRLHLNAEQQGTLLTEVFNRLNRLEVGKRSRGLITCMSALKSKFGVEGYKDIGKEQFEEAVNFIRTLPLDGELLDAESRYHYPVSQWIEDNPYFAKYQLPRNKPEITVSVRMLFGMDSNSIIQKLLIRLQKEGNDVSGCLAELLSMRHHLELMNDRITTIQRKCEEANDRILRLAY